MHPVIFMKRKPFPVSSTRTSRPGHNPIIRAAALACCFALSPLMFRCAGNPAESASSGTTVLRLSRGGVYVARNGRGFADFSRGLPDNVTPLKVHAGPDDTLYLTTWDSGLFRRGPGDDAWRNISPGEFRARTVHPIYKGYRKISAFAANPDMPGNIAAATKHDIYLSSDGGTTWKALPLNGDFRKNQVTSLALRGKSGELLAGTSYAGVFRGSGRGLAADSSGLPSEAYSDTLRFYDEIGAAFLGTGSGAFLGLSVSGEVFSREKTGAPWRKVASFPGRPAVDDIAERAGVLYVSAGGGVHTVEKGGSVRPHPGLNDLVSSSSPRGTTGTLSRWASFMMAATCSVVFGNTTASATP